MMSLLVLSCGTKFKIAAKIKILSTHLIATKVEGLWRHIALPASIVYFFFTSLFSLFPSKGKGHDDDDDDYVLS